MAWSFELLYTTMGSTGSKPAVNYQYDGEQQVADTELNYLWYALGEFEEQTRDALVDLDADMDGRVDAADTSELLKGNDLDADGDGRVDAADSTSLVRGSSMDTEYGFTETSISAEAGSLSVAYVEELADGETMTVEEASLLSADGTSAPNGVALEIVVVGSSSTTLRTTLLSGDGATLFVDETDVGSYENTTGSAETVALVVDNGVHSSGSGVSADVLAASTIRLT